ncbi:MAG: hypothetical protein JSW63_12420 [Ignavibacterium sp.]|nr:MAG: hypothetical protein JSW63_12420 [Ignavibacterium sp.]
MKKKLALLLITTCFSVTNAQGEVKAVMGINFMSIPSMQDYINQNFALPNEQLGSFVSSIVFAGEGGLFINKNFEMTVEIAYQIYSYTTTGLSGQYELKYNNPMPSLLAYYVLDGNGYNLKFGGGLGIRFPSVDESLPATGSTISYTSIGFGIIARAEGNTLLGGDIYANIGAEIRYDVNGEPESNGNNLFNVVQGENVNFNTFSLGVRLGITYIIGGNN